MTTERLPPGRDQEVQRQRLPRLEIPLILLAVAVFATLAFQIFSLMRGRGSFVALRAAQESKTRQAVKFRQQLESLASETARLADGGDLAAKQVVEAMRRQGITLKGGSN